MAWDSAPVAQSRGRKSLGPEASLVQINARRRFEDANAAAGPGLSDILWRIVCSGEGMPLEDVAAACTPSTTAQTIGRLETGTRTVSVGWLNRIADALGVDASELVAGAGGSEIAVAAVLGAGGQARAPKRTTLLVPPKPAAGIVGITVAASVGDYRAGDELWCEPLAVEDFARALNRDVLVPRPAGRFLFGRLIDRDDGRLLILPLGAGGRQQVVTDPPWLAVASRLIRAL